MNRFTFNSTFFLIVLLGVGSAALAQRERVVRVAPGFATVIVCPAPPELVTVGNMDAFSVQSAGNYILIKPLVNRGTTNMFIKSGPESFNLLLNITDNPELEVRLVPPPGSLTPQTPGGEGSAPNPDGGSGPKSSTISPQAMSILSERFKANNRYTYSVNNSNITFAVDHMKQIKDKFFLLVTIVNDSNIPYDVGYVRFKLVDYKRNFLFGKKKLKEMEMEPSNVYYNPRIPPHSSGRLLFVFDKHGFSEQNTLSIKCSEENGRRDLEIEVPGSIME